MKSEMGEHKNQLHLIVQYYRCATPERQAEIDTCLRNNLLNPYLSAIHLLTEEQFDLSQFPNCDKIVQTVVGERLTFERAFQYANDTDHDGKLIWILSNADIYFDESLRLVELKNLAGTLYALTRHDVQPDGAMKLVAESFAHGSQDAWIFTTPVDLIRMYTKFRLGIPGCDNRIAYEFLRHGLVVTNPAISIKCIHLDLSRETDIAKRTAEYVELHTRENIDAGSVAPPPWQFYLYPVREVGFEYLDTYRNLGVLQLELTRVEKSLFDRDRYIAELLLEIEKMHVERQNKEAELLVQIDIHKGQIYALLNSLSWKVLAPLRKIATIVRGLYGRN